MQQFRCMHVHTGHGEMYQHVELEQSVCYYVDYKSNMQVHGPFLTNSLLLILLFTLN